MTGATALERIIKRQSDIAVGFEFCAKFDGRRLA